MAATAALDVAAPSAVRPRERLVSTVVATAVVLWAGAITAFTGYVLPLVPHGVTRIAIVPIACECLVAPIVGLFIVRQHPRHVVGWLLVLQGLLAAPVFNADAYAGYAFVVRRGAWPGGAWAAAFNEAAWPLLFVALALIGLVFPNGRFLSRRWRRFAVGCLVLQAGYIVASMLTLRHFTDSFTSSIPVPLSLSNAPFTPLEVAGSLAVPVLLIGSVIAARQRLKSAQGDERVQMLWFATAALTIPGGIACCALDSAVGAHMVLTGIGVSVLGTVIPIAIAVAILRRRLFDVEVVLSRALTYGLLTVAVITVYAGFLLAFHAVINQSVAGLIAVGVVAVAIQPLHWRLRRRIERRVYGDRSDPYAAVRRLSQRVEGLADPIDVITAVTTSVAEALRVPRVRVELDDAMGLATAEPAQSPAERVALVHQGNRLGELVVDVPAGRQFSGADRDMLAELARHTAAVVNAVHLTLELQESRARLVSTREEERRRLRRDLHDGVGPSLAAMVLKLNAVSRIVDNEVADELLVQVRAETRAAIAEIRRLVDDLRPPALDEVGLIAALRQRAAALSESPLLISVEGPRPMPALPAAVEAAAYRIAMEAITNAARHSAATRCVVRVSADGPVELEIADNGNGFAAGSSRGVGMSSMQERARELGGACTISARDEGGTVVRAVIPRPVGAVVPAPEASRSGSSNAAATSGTDQVPAEVVIL
jgi:signal transduction histidine kinase